jgi:hypothetical protein
LYLARLRTEPKRAAGIKHNFTTPEGDVFGDLVGIKGEYAVAAYFGVRFDTYIGRPHEGDHGVDLTVGDKSIQVKSTVHKYGRIIHRESDNSDILILTVVDGNSVEIIGWCLKETFDRKKYIRDMGYGERFVMDQRDLSPIYQLDQVLWPTAEQLYDPERQIEDLKEMAYELP